MNKVLFLPLFYLIISIIPSNVLAQGDLMIMPKRVIFDGTERSHEINLANTGKDTAVYAISFINYKMTPTGSFEEIVSPEENQRFATDFLRYFPRRVSLAPNEAQTIRVQLTRTGNLEPGEYRSHMYFRAVEEQTALGAEKAQEGEGISINIKTVFGISIPIIIRHGTSTTKVQLENVALDLNGELPRLSLRINRSGNMSVYGDLSVIHSSSDGTQTEIGTVKGISVYTPNTYRDFSFDLRAASGVNLKEGSLKIRYTEDKDKTLAFFEKKLQ